MFGKYGKLNDQLNILFAQGEGHSLIFVQSQRDSADHEHFQTFSFLKPLGQIRHISCGADLG